MTREDITRMAREAGAIFDHMTWVERDLAPVFERFAALVAAAEREACAKVCDDRVTAYRYATDSWAQEHIDEARHLATAIRARGQA